MLKYSKQRSPTSAILKNQRLILKFPKIIKTENVYQAKSKSKKKNL